MDVLILSQAYQPLRRATWRDAIEEVIGGRVEVLATYADRFIRTTTEHIPMPSVVRFLTGGFNKWLLSPERPTRIDIWRRDRGECQYCGVVVSKSDFTVDHVLPSSRGGPWAWDNLVAACHPCNNYKDNKTPQEAGMRLYTRPAKPDSVGVRRWNTSMPEQWQRFLP